MDRSRPSRSQLPDPFRRRDAAVEGRPDIEPSRCVGSRGVARHGGGGTERLVRRAQAGEGPALDELFGHYRPRVVDLARRKMGARLTAREDPEDLAQTTFREAARDFSGYEYRGKRSFWAWLTRILQNKIRDRAEFHGAAKRDTRREVALDLPARFAGDERRPFELAAREYGGLDRAALNEDLARLHAGVETLPPLQRQAVRLVFFEGQSLRQAGHRLGRRSEDAVRMLIRRAARSLRDSLDLPERPA